jgi:hypothetical protein
MAAFAITHRPFASDLFTGLALPDGIFETSIGAQRINAHVTNTGAAAAGTLSVYVESTSDPGIVVTPQTHFVAALTGGAARLFSWQADFSQAVPGAHRISFVVQQGAVKTRIIKKILVTRVLFDPASGTFSAQFPEGTLGVRFHEFAGPKDSCCGQRKAPPASDGRKAVNLLDYIRRNGGRRDGQFVFCLSQYLPAAYTLTFTPNPQYAGQYSDLPFSDPWWKILLCIIAVLLLIGAAIAEAVDGSGEITVTAGGGGGGNENCCGVGAEGGGTSYIAAGLVAAAAAVATAAALSDARDPFRRGQDNTPPNAGEITLAERVDAQLSYLEPVALGKPFAVDVKWTYERTTNADTYTFSVSETQHNVHVLSEYQLDAPDVVVTYKDERFVIRGRFIDRDGQAMRGGALFVQCFMVGPAGQFVQFEMQDDGNWPDEKPNDGTYTGQHDFLRDVRKDPSARGIWTYYVIAQDVNQATPDMTPEQAAQIIGGMVVTHQLVVDFNGGTCPFVPDGHVNVI